MSHNKLKIISFRDGQETIDYLIESAEKKGVTKSDVLRMLIRERQSADAADALAAYRKNK